MICQSLEAIFIVVQYIATEDLISFRRQVLGETWKDLLTVE